MEELCKQDNLMQNFDEHNTHDMSDCSDRLHETPQKRLSDLKREALLQDEGEASDNFVVESQ